MDSHPSARPVERLVRTRQPRAYYNDNDPGACAWLRNLIDAGLLPDGDVDSRSITEIKPKELHEYTQCHFFAGIGGWPLALRMAGWPDEQPVWTGSCPCQPFSVAGKRKGEEDERHLWPAIHALIDECRPATFYGEQVSGAAGRAWLARVRRDLETCGYAVGAGDFCSSAFGICQQRERLFYVALSPIAEPARRLAALWGERWTAEVGQVRRFTDWRESCETGVLDDGIPSRLAKTLVRGFGNAIVPQVAAEFIAVSVESANTEVSGRAAGKDNNE